LHMVAALPAGSAPGAAAIRAAANVECKLLSETRLVPRDGDGFVLGFSGHDLTEMVAAARRLGAAARTLHRG
ncbi:MAG TPA: PLP-dependent aminotransferase family protein, partial [Azospirillaceae bacterium]|nr:PLP-dependent aminotransferase family protein [Azospirillaceae bacterium]